MPTTPSVADWDRFKAFYDGLTLQDNGDSLEKEAVELYGLGTEFPNYERFWKFHIAPATYRPANDRIRDEAHKHISFMIQRQYSVLYYLVISSSYRKRVMEGDLGGEGRRHAFNAIIYAGNALQVFDNLKWSIEHLNVARDYWHNDNFLFYDWATNWESQRNRLCSYRNYLIHQGVLHTEYKREPSSDQQTPHVRRMEANEDHLDRFTWTQHRVDFKSNPQNYVSLVELCDSTVGETIKWANDAFEVIISKLDPLLALPAYRRLWGWR